MNPFALRRILVRDLSLEYPRFATFTLIFRFVLILVMAVVLFAWVAFLASLFVYGASPIVLGILLFYVACILVADIWPTRWWLFGLAISLGAWSGLRNKNSLIARTFAMRVRWCAENIPRGPTHIRWIGVMEFAVLSLFALLLSWQDSVRLFSPQYWSIMGSTFASVLMPLIDPIVPFLEMAGVGANNNTEAPNIGLALVKLSIQAIFFYAVFVRTGTTWTRAYGQDNVMRANYFGAITVVETHNSRYELVDFGPLGDSFASPQVFTANQVRQLADRAFDQLVAAYRGRYLVALAREATNQRSAKFLLWPSRDPDVEASLIGPSDLQAISVVGSKLHIKHSNALRVQPRIAKLKVRLGEMFIVADDEKVIPLGPVLLDPFETILKSLTMVSFTRLKDDQEVESVDVAIEPA